MAELRGVGVLVTRPRHQAHNLCQRLERAGARVILYPVLEIAEPSDPAALEAVLARLAEFDLAIFISANAVERSLPRIAAHGGLPPRLHIAAVGRRTAEVLASRGVRVSVVPEQRFDSEALLATPQLQQVDGRRVLIFRGEGGRELLAETLRQRGAHVEYAECYRRAQPAADPAPLLELWCRGQIDIAVITSNDGLRNLIDMIGVEGQQWLRKTPLAVIGERTAQLAQALGAMYPPLIAREASDDALFEAIINWRRTQDPVDRNKEPS